MGKTRERDTIRAARIKRTAEICQVTERQVQRVLNADQENQNIVMTYMTLQEGENSLIAAVKELVPFN
jgi:hypothetical protein